MTVRAVVLPGSPLLVPGAAGRAVVLHAVRDAAIAALRGLVADAPQVVVVAAGHDAGPDVVRGPARASLAAAGVPDARVDGAWRRPTLTDVPRVAGPAASVALLALSAAGWAGPVDVVEIGACPADDHRDDTSRTGSPRERCRALGEELRRQGARVVVVEDPRSSALTAVLEGLVDPAWEVHADVSTGEYEERPYEVRRFTHRTSSSTPVATVSR